jgi:hypothetical protein
VTWLKEILLTFPRQGVEWNKACREEGKEIVEQLEDGPIPVPGGLYSKSGREMDSWARFDGLWR